MSKKERFGLKIVDETDYSEDKCSICGWSNAERLHKLFAPACSVYHAPVLVVRPVEATIPKAKELE